MTRPFAALSATLVVAAVVLSACGGGDAKASGTPSAPTTSATPSPSPTKTKTTPPLSRFEGEAPVVAMRDWARLMELAVNHHDRPLAPVRRVATPAGIRLLRRVYADDFAHGYRWPGPQPFTPTHVAMDGRTATVSTCIELSGWSIGPDGKAVRKRAISPAVFTLKRVGSAWKIDKVVSGAFSCSKVKVRESR